MQDNIVCINKNETKANLMNIVKNGGSSALIAVEIMAKNGLCEITKTKEFPLSAKVLKNIIKSGKDIALNHVKHYAYECLNPTPVARRKRGQKQHDENIRWSINNYFFKAGQCRRLNVVEERIEVYKILSKNTGIDIIKMREDMGYGVLFVEIIEDLGLLDDLVIAMKEKYSDFELLKTKEGI
ncbi:MAG: hypothetical protein ACRCTZ_16160 [Sarcina sp.]